MNIKVISMETSNERRKNFINLNKHIKFDFFNAVDGNQFTQEFIASTNLFEKGLPYTAGAYGCALSHLILWDEAINLDKVITIAEDDAIFRFDFENLYKKKLNSLPPDWDIVLWGWNFDSILSLNVMPNISPVVMVFNQDQLRNSIKEFQEFAEDTTLLRLDKCFGTICYSISPSGAAKFKSLCLPMSNFLLFFPLLNRQLPNNGIDIAMNKIYQATNSYVAFPPLVITKNDHTITTIQNPQSN
ncbi:MAG: glycosyltransferase family 25 protein [Betaproteobacteria bacterium]|nr:glycosyltransferase family 25 protein [Betaproteobacteria bacterium]